MNKLWSTKRNTLLTYGVFCGTLTLLSLFFLFINVYEVTMVLGVATIFNFFYLLLILSFGKSNDGAQKLSSMKNLVVFNIFRSMIEIVSVVACGLMIAFIPSLIAIDGYSKYKYLYLLISLFPYFVCLGLFALNSKAEVK